MTVEIGAEAAQFPENEYKNGIFLEVCARKLSLYQSHVQWMRIS
jgi:hypothetical protein